MEKHWPQFQGGWILILLIFKIFSQTGQKIILAKPKDIPKG